MNRDLFIFDANEELRKIQTHSGQGIISAISKISSPPVVNSLFDNNDKKKIDAAIKLIADYARFWRETEKNIEEYINEQLVKFSLDDLINCFISLHADIQHLHAPPANTANLANPYQSGGNTHDLRL